MTVSDVLTAIVALAALVVAGSVAHREFGRADPQTDSSGVPSVTLGSEWEQMIGGKTRLGAADPRVTIVEFTDYQCPACRRYEGVLRAILSEHPTQVAVVYRALPLEGIHPIAYTAAKGSHCAASQGRFEAFHRVLFEQQNRLGEKSQLDFAGESGVPDLSLFERCVSSTDRMGSIEVDLRLASELGLGATPTIAVNGTLFRRLPDSVSLRRIVADLLRQTSGG
jgi:protein-disulfide isomerase